MTYLVQRFNFKITMNRQNLGVLLYSSFKIDLFRNKPNLFRLQALPKTTKRDLSAGQQFLWTQATLFPPRLTFQSLFTLIGGLYVPLLLNELTVSANFQKSWMQNVSLNFTVDEGQSGNNFQLCWSKGRNGHLHK